MFGKIIVQNSYSIKCVWRGVCVRECVCVGGIRTKRELLSNDNVSIKILQNIVLSLKPQSSN